MQKITNRLISKVVLACLIINTLPVHLSLYGSALPKGQELVTLKKQINRDIHDIRKTVSLLKNVRIIGPSIVIGAGVIATIIIFATMMLLAWGIKRGLKKRYANKIKDIDLQMKELRDRSKKEQKLDIWEKTQKILKEKEQQLKHIQVQQPEKVPEKITQKIEELTKTSKIELQQKLAKPQSLLKRKLKQIANKLIKKKKEELALLTKAKSTKKIIPSLQNEAKKARQVVKKLTQEGFSNQFPTVASKIIDNIGLETHITKSSMEPLKITKNMRTAIESALPQPLQSQAQSIITEIKEIAKTFFSFDNDRISSLITDKLQQITETTTKAATSTIEKTKKEIATLQTKIEQLKPAAQTIQNEIISLTKNEVKAQLNFETIGSKLAEKAKEALEKAKAKLTPKTLTSKQIKQTEEALIEKLEKEFEVKLAEQTKKIETETKQALSLKLANLKARKPKPEDDLSTLAFTGFVLANIVNAAHAIVITPAIAGLSFLVIHAITVVAADRAAKQLEEIEKKYPGLLTRRQKQTLEEYQKLLADPRMQGIVKNMHLRVALSNIVDDTIAQHPALVEALGGTKKAAKAFKKYAKRKWDETTLQRALDVGVGKLMRFKFKVQLGITRLKLKSQGKKLAAQITKAQLNVAQLKKALNSTAQTYIQQADDIIEDLKNRLIEAIEAEAEKKLKKAVRPIIEL